MSIVESARCVGLNFTASHTGPDRPSASMTEETVSVDSHITRDLDCAAGSFYNKVGLTRFHPTSRECDTVHDAWPIYFNVRQVPEPYVQCQVGYCGPNH